MNTLQGTTSVIAWLVAITAALSARDNLRADDFLIESRFNQALQEPISATVPRTEVREFLQRISSERQVAIVLDARVDPHQLCDIAWVDIGLREAIESLSANVSAATTIVGDTFVIGPSDSIQNLRTLIALRFDELEGLATTNAQNIARLRRRASLAWRDLDRPSDLVEAIASAHGLRVENPQALPHDLWTGSTIANANAVEQLSIVLMQLDLAFEWNGDATAIRLVPYPAVVTVEKEHRPRGMTVAEAEAAVLADFPDLQVAVAGRALSVTARIEEHEQVEVLLGIREPRESVSPASAPLARRTFTLTVVNQPVGAVLQALVDQGVPIEYDAEALTSAGADLSMHISLQLRDARITELMEEICEPVRIKFEVDGEKVRLSVE